jgi:hypothetical protein
LRRAAWLTALGLAAAPTPAALAADAGAVPPVPGAGELALAVLEDAGIPIPLPVPEVDPLPALPAAPAQPAAAEPAPTGAGAAPPPQPVEQTAPVAVPEPPPAVSLPPAQPEPDAPAAPPAPEQPVQQEPANVSVSVRIESPGDDGAVTQVNVAAAVDAPQYQPESPRYQPVVAPEAPPPAAETAAEVPASGEPAWTWEWGCGGDPFGEIALPAGVAPQTWIWNWNWNCGDDESASVDNGDEITSGYHAAPAQYRPVNINVSIRVASPGDNGPVVQANVAVGVTIPPLPVPAAPPAATAPPAPPAPPVASAPAIVPADAAPPPASAPAPSAPAAPEAEAAPAEELDDCCRLAEPRGVAYAADPPASIVLAAGAAPDPPEITFTGADAVVVAARLELRARRAVTPAAAPQRPQARPARSAPPREASPEDEPAAVQQSGFGLAPAEAPERSLPFVALVLLAFAFASAKPSWAAVRSGPTPGADPDEPPDRPG